MDTNPANDPLIECKARERVAGTLLSSGVFTTHIAFSVVKNGSVHFADAFTYIGQGQYVHDPSGITRLYRIGSTSKSIASVAAKALAEAGELSFGDFVNDDDATRIPSNGERTLRQLLSHQGAFRVDNGAIHLFCYPGDLQAFWSDPDDLVSPHYDSAVYGNLGGGFEYSAFNYSLAGAYMANRTGKAFADILQTRVFDGAGMCTASLDGPRAVNTPMGNEAGVSQTAVMHVGPYINLVSPTDPRCEDNFYSSNDRYGDPYSWQSYRLDEAAAEARDPAGGVIASVGQCVHKIAGHPDVPGRLYMQNHGGWADWTGPGGPRPDIGVLRSDDHGKSWRSIAKGLPTDFGFPIVVHPQNPDAVYVMPHEPMTRTCPGGIPAVWRSENGGDAWKRLTRGFPKKNSFYTVQRDAMDVDHTKTPALYFGTTTGQLWIGREGGEQWDCVFDSLPPIHCVKVAVV